MDTADTMDTSARVCLVTGANAGIGRAASEQLARAGHTVLMGCRDQARGEAAAAALRAAVPGAKVSVLEVDLSLKASVRAAAARIESLDVLIHNAAYFDVKPRQTRGRHAPLARGHLGPSSPWNFFECL